MKLLGKIVAAVIIFGLIIYGLKLLFAIAVWSFITIFKIAIVLVPIVCGIIALVWIRRKLKRR